MLTTRRTTTIFHRREFRRTSKVLVCGGSTEVEVQTRKDRVDDALHATRAAVEEGIVPGGGVALAHASLVLPKLKADNDGQRFGVEIVRKAIQQPLRHIAENSGEDGTATSCKVLDKDGQTGL